MANPRRPYVAVLVTLASANTVYNLLDLVNTILAAETQGDNTVRAPGMVRSISLQAFNGVDGSGGNTKDVLIGDALLATTRMGYVLTIGQGSTYSSTWPNADFGSLYAMSAGTAQKICVELVMS